MPKRDGDRLVWAVDRLDVQPTDRLLEIGCGPGIALALVADLLRGGRVVGLDRSAKMIAAAEKRNRDLIESGRVSLLTADLASARFGRQRFDKVFAIRVNVFWTESGRVLAEMKAIARALSSEGTLHLFFDSPGDRLNAIAGKVEATLAANKFSLISQTLGETDAGRSLHVLAAPQ